MSDNLFQEIDVDLQRQKMEALWKSYGAYVIAGILAIVLATAAFTAWKNYSTKKEQQATSKLLEITGEKVKDKAAQIAALEDFTKSNPSTSLAVMAKLRAAATELNDGKTDDAIAMYDSLAADANVEPVFRQLAILLSVQAQIDKGDPVALRAKLQPLLADSTWRYSAKDYSALLALKSGDKAGAVQFYTELAQDNETPETISARAKYMLSWIDEGSK